MHLERVHIDGFGKWQDTSFTFAKGLNVIEAPNEAGKSTLLAALGALLFGMKKDYVKKAIRREEWQRYVPWQGQAYGGHIVYQLKEGRYRLERNLHTDEHRLYTEDALRDVSKDYELDYRKERNYVTEQIGLTQTLFTELTHIGTIGIHNHQQMMEWLHQQVDTEGQVAASYRDVFALLDQQKREIGRGEQGKETRLARAHQQLKVARTELMHAKERMHQLRQLESKKHDLEHQLRILEVPGAGLEVMMTLQDLQMQREQTLLSKQQFARFLLDLERLQEEEERLHFALGHEARKCGSEASLRNDMETLRKELTEVEQTLVATGEQIEQVKAEADRSEAEVAFPRDMAHSDRTMQTSKRWGGMLRGLAFGGALLGIGVLFIGPWYYGVGIWGLALFSYIGFLHLKKKQLSYDKKRTYEIELQERVHERRRQMEQLYAKSLDLERRRTELHERLRSLESLLTLFEHKERLLFLFEPLREEDRAFIQHWQRIARQEDFSEEHLVEAWVQHMKRMDVQIEGISSRMHQWSQYEGERERLLRALAHIEGEMKTYEGLSVATYENRYEFCRAQVEEWERKRDVLELARQIFQETIDEWNALVSPAISSKTSAIFTALTSGRYQEVKADPTQQFALRVVEQPAQKVREQQQLSSGTVQQLYFALRLAFIDYYSPAVRLPIFLDDSFTHYDDTRLAAALLTLGEIARDHQVFLFTCQARERGQLDALRLPYQRHVLE